MASRNDLRLGMTVLLGNGSKYTGAKATVDKVNPRTVDVTMENGGKLRTDPFYIVIPGSENELEAAVGAMSKAEVVPFVPAPQPGTAVRVSARIIAQHGQKLAGIWIVCGGQGDKSRIFRLNNKDGRYWRIPNADLIPINAVVTEVQ